MCSLYCRQCRGKILARLCPVEDIEIGVEFVLPIDFFSVTGSTAAPQQVISELPVFRFQKRRENEGKPAPQQGSIASSSNSAMGNSTLSRSSSTDDTATHVFTESTVLGNSQRTAAILRQEQGGLQKRHSSSSSNVHQLSSAHHPDQQQHLNGLQDCTSGQALDSSRDSCSVPQHSSIRCSCTNNSAYDKVNQSVKQLLSQQDGRLLLLQEHEQQHLPRMPPQLQQQQQEQHEENEAGTAASCSTGGESSSSSGSGTSGGSDSVQDGATSCVICFADYDEGEMIKQLPCQVRQGFV